MMMVTFIEVSFKILMKVKSPTLRMANVVFLLSDCFIKVKIPPKKTKRLLAELRHSLWISRIKLFSTVFYHNFLKK